MCNALPVVHSTPYTRYGPDDITKPDRAMAPDSNSRRAWAALVPSIGTVTSSPSVKHLAFRQRHLSLFLKD